MFLGSQEHGCSSGAPEAGEVWGKAMGADARPVGRGCAQTVLSLRWPCWQRTKELKLARSMAAGCQERTETRRTNTMKRNGIMLFEGRGREDEEERVE